MRKVMFPQGLHFCTEDRYKAINGAAILPYPVDYLNIAANETLKPCELSHVKSIWEYNQLEQIHIGSPWRIDCLGILMGICCCTVLKRNRQPKRKICIHREAKKFP